MKLLLFFTKFLLISFCTCKILKPLPRNLFLVWRTENEAMNAYKQSLGYEKFSMKNYANKFRAARIENQIDEVLQQAMDDQHTKYSRIMEKLDDADRQIEENFSNFYQKYVQMPYIGNFAYLDPTNPLSLH